MRNPRNLPDGLYSEEGKDHDVFDWGHHIYWIAAKIPRKTEVGRIRYIPERSDMRLKLADTIRVLNIDVEPEYQRRGIATALVETVKQKYPDMNVVVPVAMGKGVPFWKTQKARVLAEIENPGPIHINWNLSSTDMPYYNNLMAQPEYFAKNKGIKGEIIWMSPREYIKQVAKQQNTNLEQQKQMLTLQLVKEYTEAMEKGARFPIPLLDYAVGLQDGRHRAFAAEKLGAPSIPVLVVTKVEMNPRKLPSVGTIINRGRYGYEKLEYRIKLKGEPSIVEIWSATGSAKGLRTFEIVPFDSDGTREEICPEYPNLAEALVELDRRIKAGDWDSYNPIARNPWRRKWN
jgi:GNAT superfamily N-acetyltransferase